MPEDKWRKYVDPLLKDYLEFEIAEAEKHEPAFNKAKNPSLAQIWCAIANISKKISELDLRFRRIEKSLADLKNNKELENFKKILEKL